MYCHTQISVGYAAGSRDIVPLEQRRRCSLYKLAISPVLLYTQTRHNTGTRPFTRREHGSFRGYCIFSMFLTAIERFRRVDGQMGRTGVFFRSNAMFSTLKLAVLLPPPKNVTRTI